MSSKRWKETILGEIAQINMGQSPESKYYNSNKEGYPFLQGNRTFGYRYPHFDTYCTEGKKFADKGEVLVSVRAPVGDINIATERICIGRGVASLKINNGMHDFLFYLLKANVSELINKESGTVFGSVNKDDLFSLRVKVPESVEIQFRISSILSSFDEKIELNRQTNQTLEATAQAIYKEWFVDFNFPGANGEMKDSELGVIPRGWHVVPLGEITDLTWGDTNTTKKSYVNEGYPAYSASGHDGFLPYHDFDRDGIVVSAIGAYAGKTWFAIGKWSCIKNTIRFWSVNSEISNEYLYIATSGSGFWPLRGSAQPFISQTDARCLKILFPSENIAKTFGEITHPMFEQIEENNIQNNYLEQVRDALLPKLMSGEIEI